MWIIPIFVQIRNIVLNITQRSNHMNRHVEHNIQQLTRTFFENETKKKKKRLEKIEIKNNKHRTYQEIYDKVVECFETSCVFHSKQWMNNLVEPINNE